MMKIKTIFFLLILVTASCKVQEFGSVPFLECHEANFKVINKSSNQETVAVFCDKGLLLTIDVEPCKTASVRLPIGINTVHRQGRKPNPVNMQGCVIYKLILTDPDEDNNI